VPTGMRERTLTIGSAGKTFSVTGWKVGWVVGPRDIVPALHASRTGPRPQIIPTGACLAPTPVHLLVNAGLDHLAGNTTHHPTTL